MQELAARFVCVADEVWPLQTGKDPLAKFFQTIAEQGHYAGRTTPSTTRQGIYAFAPGGAFLGSINTRSSRAMVRMLREALQRFEELPREQRSAPELPERTARVEDRFPKDGLIFEVFSRDALRKDNDLGEPLETWHRYAANRDQLWWQQSRLKGFLPEELRVGATAVVDPEFTRRLATCNLIDNVRGQTLPNPKESILGTELHAEITAIDADVIHLRFSGPVKIAVEGRWTVMDELAAKNPLRQRGMKGDFYGSAIWNRSTERFDSFALLALVLRQGATQYNARNNDQKPALMGFAVRLAREGTPPIGPAHYWSY